MRRHSGTTAARIPIATLALVVALSSAASAGTPEEGAPAAASEESSPGVPSSAAELARLRALQDMPDPFASARVLPGGSWLLGYSYEHLTRSSNRSGTNRVSVSQIFERGFERTSFRQSVERHTVEVLYAPTERITLGVALPFLDIDTRYRLPDGTSFTTGNQGVGDLEFSGRLLFIRKDQQSLYLHLGLQAPTGEIDARGRTPSGRERLPYDEQVGSGTWNFLPGLTYLGAYDQTSWGIELGAQVYVADNDNGWSRGDIIHTGGWLAQRFFDLLTSSLWLEWSEWSDINGKDDHISRTWPSGNPNFYGGASLVLGSSLEVAIPGLRGQRLAVDASFPVYQSIDGPQLQSHWRLKAGWEWVF